jgi:hypothetical protein
MKQWLSDRLLSIKHGATYARAFFSPVVFVLYVLLFLQWLVTPYVHVWHLLGTFVIVGLIDGISFKQGIACERVWSSKHPKR